MSVHPSRVAVENVRPVVECGRFPIKRTVGETVSVTADVHADGHDVVVALLRWKAEGDAAWTEVAMEPLGNDAWRASFPIRTLRPHEFEVEGWIDAFRTWRRDLVKRRDAGQELDVELLVGARLLASASERAGKSADASPLRAAAKTLSDAKLPPLERVEKALAGDLLAAMDRHADRRSSARSDRSYPVSVEPELARFSAWYEFFPRSPWGKDGAHGTLRDAEARLDAIAAMGFDVVYLPPIHPIGTTHRKGKNNSTEAEAGDPGSPWAIGSKEGGHDAVHPDLGTKEDLRKLVASARERGLEVALDLAFQCSPDHPWVKEHPQWFRTLPDGSIRYAENPPKKYQDIYPLDFESDDWKGLWEALAEVVRGWIALGVKVFRVDNPHTKPYPFWEWLIGTIRREHPETIFLSEAFTRPKVMARLAKVGFSQSYTYFTWRNTAREIRDYVEELTRTELREYFRPNFWPNTPDILPEFLQAGGPAAFRLRLALAATLSPSYGIYGPAYEACEAEPVAPGREEYRNSEKYEVRAWEPGSLREIRSLATRLNKIRRECPALRTNEGLRFHETDDEALLAFSKRDPGGDDLVVVVASVDPHHKRAGHVTLDGLGLDDGRAYQMHDLLGDERFLWSGPRNLVEIDPDRRPAYVFRVRRRLKTEHDFDYFL